MSAAIAWALVAILLPAWIFEREFRQRIEDASARRTLKAIEDEAKRRKRDFLITNALYEVGRTESGLPEYFNEQDMQSLLNDLSAEGEAVRDSRMTDLGN